MLGFDGGTHLPERRVRSGNGRFQPGYPRGKRVQFRADGVLESGQGLDLGIEPVAHFAQDLGGHLEFQVMPCTAGVVHQYSHHATPTAVLSRSTQTRVSPMSMS